MVYAVFVFGLVIGSFLNVCIWRIPRNESIVYKGSHCTACGASIRPYDLVPVISFLALRGKCRACGSSISPRYPLTELLTAALYSLIALKLGLNISSLFFMILTSIMIVVAFVDLDFQIVPDGLIYALGAAGLLYVLTVLLPLNGVRALLDAAIGFLLGGVLFFAAAVVSNGGMGGGDIKLAAVLGLWFGWKNLLLLMLLSFVSAAVVSVFLLLTKRKNRKDGVPFAPFIAFSAYITPLLGKELINWYLTTINLMLS